MSKSGIARTDITIEDLSAIIVAGLKGIHGVLAITEWGPLNEPILVSSWADYVRNFGGLLSDVDDPLIIKRALEAGASLKVVRVGHYTDVTDDSTLDGTAASGTIGDETDGVDFVAKSIGAWGNKVKITSVAAENGVENEFDYTIEVIGNSGLTQILRNVAINPSAAQIDKFNEEAKYVSIDEVNGTPTAGTVTLTSGAQDRSAIVTTDFIGDSSTNVGLRAFDEDTDITKIAAPGKADPALDTALVAYADMRKDIIALLRTPVGVDGATAVDYREGSGAYSHAAHNSWRAFMFTGGLKITHPVTGIKRTITELGDVMGLMSKKDNEQFEWFSFSGPKRGLIKNVLGVAYNLGSNARKQEANKVDIHGVNMVINHPSFGPVAWGNSSLSKAPTLLKHANIAELMVFLERALKPLTEFETFDPNDIETWKQIHRRVTPLLDFIKDNRGIWDYVYQGDQDVDDISQISVNTTDNIDAGVYNFEIYIKPKVAMKYIGVKVGVTNSGTDFSIFEA